MTNAIWKTLFGPGDNPEDLNGPDRLSEDACGDLVQSLIRLGYISDIVTGADGRTFITYQQLQEDILVQLEKRHGRVSTLDLPKVLNATLSDIQDRVQDLIRQQSNNVVLVQDELVKVKYLDSLAEQLNIELSQRGHLIVSEQCRKYKFGIDFMRQFLRDRVGVSIDGHWDAMDRSLVITPWFLEQEKSTLRSILNELKEPTTLQNIKARRAVLDQLFFGLCESLSKEQGLPGVFKGINEQGTFIPRPYEQQQSEWIETFFKNNGFIEIDALRKRGITDPRGHIQANHPTALLLETYIVGDNIWSIVDASVEDAITNLSWIDVKPLLPTPLTKDDVSSLLRQLPSLAEPTSRIAIASDQDHSLTGLRGGPPQETIILQNSVVVTSGQFQKCLLKMGPLLDRSAKALFSWRLSFGSNDLIEGGAEDTEGLLLAGSTSLKSHIENASKANSSRKGNKTKNSLASRDSETKKQLQDFLTIQDVQEEVRNLEPEFDSVLVNAVARALHQDLLQNLRDRNRTMVLSQAEEDHEQDQAHDDIAQVTADREALGLQGIRLLSDRIVLHAKAINAFEDVSAKNSLSKHLLQTLCVELVDNSLLYLAMTQSDSKTNVSADAIKAREHLQSAASDRSNISPALSASAEDTTLLLEFLSPDEQGLIQRLLKLTAGSGKHKNLVEFLDVWAKFSKGFKNAQVTSNFDQLLEKHMQELHGALSGLAPQSDAALMLHIVVMILFQSWTGTMLHASGKYVPRILRQLRISVDQDETIDPSEQEIRRSRLGQLESMLDHVMSKVKQGSSVAAEGPKDGDRLWLDVRALGMTASAR